MGVVDIERARVARLATEIAEDLRASGVARAAVADVEDVDRWRQAARQAGRVLGWHVRTSGNAQWVWAVSENWDPPPSAQRDAAHVIEDLMNRASWDSQ